MDRESLISAVKTPTALATLGLLVAEALLGAALTQVTQGSFHQTILISAMAFCAIVAFINVSLALWLGRSPTTSPTPSPSGSTPFIDPIHRCDIFLSTLMDALSDNEVRKEHRAIAVQVQKHLESYNYNVFYAGDSEEMTDARHFDDPTSAIKQNVDLVRSCRAFVLIYTEKRASSILIEVGMALALNKPCLWLVRKGAELPYLMQGATNAYEERRISRVRIIHYEDAPHLESIFARNGKKWLDEVM